MKTILLFELIFFLILSHTTTAQEKNYKLSDVVVTAGRNPVSFSNLSRLVTVLEFSELKTLPAGSIIDLFKYVNSVDLKTRGAEGVQGDIGIRGGSFEQTLVMINGIKISDPQTGHHNLNLPLLSENIERIEILKGQGSRIFGPNAFAGAVNFITKKVNDPLLSLSVLGGQNNLYGFGFSTSYPVNSLNNNLSFEKKRSDGYKHNTNFEITNISYENNLSFGNSAINFLIGYSDKKFGANNYYSDLFPNQTERTISKFANLSAEIGVDNFILSPKFYWRHNNDDYILDYIRPDWYHNLHNTNSYGTEVQASINSNFGISSFGGEIIIDEIRSTNLGNHERTKGGFFAEQLFIPTNNISLSFGFFIYNYSNTGWKFWPGFDASYRYNENVKIFFSYGRAFRIPTFTELFYVSPANLGNPNLKYEETTNFELGGSYNQIYWDAEASIFYKNGKNIIDWARNSSKDSWKVENVTNLKTLGTELSLSIYPKKINRDILFKKISISYTFLSFDRNTGIYQSKYLLDQLRHQFIAIVSHDLPFKLEQSWSFVFRDRLNFESQFSIDTQINFRIDYFDLFLRATNLLNKTHFDFPGVQLPGRWISAGLKFATSNL